MAQDNKDTVHPGVVMYHLCQLIDQMTRLYDTVTGGFFQYFHPDLPTLSKALNGQFRDWFPALREDGEKIGSYFLPYDQFDIKEVFDTWYLEQRPKLQELRFLLEASVRFASGGDNKLPEKCLLFMRAISSKIDAYELNRHKFDAQQFNSYYQEQNRVANEERASRLKSFPDESFEFIDDKQVKLTLISFYDELRETYFTTTVRSPVILSGAIIEALLKEALKHDKIGATSALKSLEEKSSNGEIESWTFSDTIDVCLKIGVLPLDLETQMDAVRNFRNFVHIHKSVEFGAQLDSNFKDICKGALAITIQWVRQWLSK